MIRASTPRFEPDEQPRFSQSNPDPPKAGRVLRESDDFGPYNETLEPDEKPERLPDGEVCEFSLTFVNT